MSSYPTSAQFAELLIRSDLGEVVETYIFRGVPYAFRDNQADYLRLLGHISEGLGVPQEDLTLIGSGRIGFSLDPDRYGSPFSDASDLDMVIVSAQLFDASWLDLLRWHRAYWRLPESVKRSHVEHQQHVYFGRIWPHKLTGILTLAPRWFEVFKSVSRYPELAVHEVHGLLYRTWDHARLYHIYGLRRILRRLPSEEG
jgi:hypothetical protein